jgi:hypothetical protein
MKTRWLPILVAVAAFATVSATAYAEDPDVKSTDKGVTLKGEGRKKVERGSTIMDEPDRSKPHRPAKPPHSTKKAPAVVNALPYERGSCANVGFTDQTLINRGCIDAPKTPPAPNRPARPRVEQITTEVVRRELKNVNFPALSVQVQPQGRTLVNLKTIVYTKPIPVDQIVPILSWPVGVRATASSYTWIFGDGTTATSTSEGTPYPAFDVFHQYKKRGKVAITVTVHYTARYQLPGQGWTTLAGTVDITGAATALTVAEARPALIDPER